MADQLLVRIYNVNLGDFIYLRVPDTNRAVHILVDCGTLSAMDVLTDRLEKLKADLPQDEDGKWHLDLLVVTHPHLDHHKGFTPEHFDDFKIKNLWLSPAYDRHNPKAAGFFALKDATLLALNSLYGFAQGRLKTEVGGLLEMNNFDILEMKKSEIIEHLCGGMGQDITPLFVSADTPPEKLKIFESEDIQLKVLSPMSNIDGWYMGAAGLDISHAGAGLGLSFDAESMSLEESVNFSRSMAEGYDQLYKEQGPGEPAVPQNISPLDFMNLQNRLRSNALALAQMTGKIENNLSVVLLLEWHGIRLLFPGDAEWSSSYKGAVKAGSCNGAWNVMWKERTADLSLPLDFLKVGHHGSENATPWYPKKENQPEHAINKILDAMLPPDRKESAIAVVSTERTNRYPSIPDGKLLKEFAKRVNNVRSDYVETSTSEKILAANTPQPQRTDLELSMIGESGPYIEKYFNPQEDFD
jgi:hypothetical protein